MAFHKPKTKHSTIVGVIGLIVAIGGLAASSLMVAGLGVFIAMIAAFDMKK